MSEEAIEEFGKRIVLSVRDCAVPQSDLIQRLDRTGAGMERLRAAAAAAGGRVPAAIVIPNCVDKTVFYVLHAMDHDCDLHLFYTTTAGESVDMSVVGWGEPIGWYIGIPGWRSWYSTARIDDRDDFAHIAIEMGVEDDADDPAPILDDLPMPRRAIEELGILLVRHVRDVAIQSCDLQLLPHSQTPMAKRWRRAAIPFEGKVPPHVLIPDCVDETIVIFLRAIDQGLLPLSFVAENGETINLVEDGHGQLAAQYDRWRAKYSKERFTPD